MTASIQEVEKKKGTPSKRPGPFGPARDLLPQDQQLETIRDTETVAFALERMVDSGFSQLPVVNEDNEITGVFSFESFGQRMSEIYSVKPDLSKLTVKETGLAQPRFIDPDLYIDTETDWSKIDHVLVGNKNKLLGVLTISDVLGRLNDFAEAFVLLYEIEHEIRDLIVDVLSEEELQAAFETISQKDSWPAEKAKKVLQELLDGGSSGLDESKDIESVKFAVHFIEKSLSKRTVNELTDSTFGQYQQIIFNRLHWVKFEPVFDLNKEIFIIDFKKINELRNIVFHFRRGVTPKDTDRLRRFRDLLRYNRGLFHEKRERGNS